MDEVIIREREFRENIVKTINSSGLPAFIIKPFLKELLIQLDNEEQQQYLSALENTKQKEQKEKEKKEESENAENKLCE